MEIDINGLGEAKIMDIAVECLFSLSLDVRIRTVLKCFDEEEKKELASWVKEEIGEEEEE